MSRKECGPVLERRGHERLKATAKELVDTGWIAVDHDAEEGLIRTYIRDDWAGDNIFKGAVGRALLCQSPLLRATLLPEIRQLSRECKPEQLELIDALESSIPSGFDFSLIGPPSPFPSPAPSPDAFKRPPDAVNTPSERRSVTHNATPTEDAIQREMR